MKANTAMKAVLLVSLVGLLAACGNQSDLTAWVNQVKQKRPGPIEPIPDLSDFERFTYAAQDLKNPFLPPVAAANSNPSGPRPDVDRPREPLEDFEMDGLKMVGTIGGGARLSGLVTDPNKVTHRISVGQHMGKRDGRVVDIQPDRIVLVELVADGSGGWEEKEASIVLVEE